MRYVWFKKIVFAFMPKKKTKKYGFPSYIVKTDEIRLQNMPWVLESCKDVPMIVTEKLDGTSSTFGLQRIKKNKFDFAVCSRNVRQTTPEIANPYAVSGSVLSKSISTSKIFTKFVPASVPAHSAATRSSLRITRNISFGATSPSASATRKRLKKKSRRSKRPSTKRRATSSRKRGRKALRSCAARAARPRTSSNR